MSYHNSIMAIIKSLLQLVHYNGVVVAWKPRPHISLKPAEPPGRQCQNIKRPFLHCNSLLQVSIFSTGKYSMRDY